MKRPTVEASDAGFGMDVRFDNNVHRVRAAPARSAPRTLI